LPRTPGFENARTMTFGYNSSLADRANLAGIRDWADDLLESVGTRRKALEVCRVPSYLSHSMLICAQEQCRPLIFVCHSLGGIVAREVGTKIPLTVT
jgi:hypothetical protein